MPETSRTVTLTIPQVVAALFFGVAVVGILSTATYMAGRSGGKAGSIMEVYAAEPSAVNSPVKAQETAAAGSRTERASEPAPVTQAAEKPPDVCPSWSTEPSFQEPKPGELYLQAIATTAGIAQVYVEYLRRQGFPARYGTGPNEHAYRVLVGPIIDREQYDEFQRRLEADGFRPFRRRLRPKPEDAASQTVN